MTMIKIQKKEKLKLKKKNIKKSYLSLKIATKAKISKTKLAAPLETLQGGLGMLERSRIFKKVLSVELNRQK